MLVGVVKTDISYEASLVIFINAVAVSTAFYTAKTYN